MSDSLQPYGLQPARLFCPWGYCRQEYGSELPCPTPADLLKPGIKPVSLMPPALASTWEAPYKQNQYINIKSYTGFAAILVFTRLAYLTHRHTEIQRGMFLMSQLPDFEQYSRLLLCHRIGRKVSMLLNLILNPSTRNQNIDNRVMGGTV